MPSFDWITARIPSFGEIKPEQIEEVRNFPILWAIFEARSLNKNGNPDAIKRRVQQWNARNILAAERFSGPLSHFRTRYYRRGDFTENFIDLYANGQDPDQTLSRVISNSADTPVERVQAVLLVVNRYRNNFLHGPKIEWGLANQVANFEMANLALVAAIETEEVFQAL